MKTNNYRPIQQDGKKTAKYLTFRFAPIVYLFLFPLLIFTVAYAAFLFLPISTPLLLILTISCMLLLSGFLLFLCHKLHFQAQNLNEILFQSRKMALIGQMSSGIAHELNTPFNIIIQELELLHLALQEQNPGWTEKISENAKQIQMQVDRCTKITHGILNFAKELHTVEQKTDINRLVQDMVNWVEKEANKQKIVIKQHLFPELPEINTDAPLLQHVILNLLNNAIQAIGQNGQIDITTDLQNETFILQVKDSGKGINPQDFEAIFTPFFTTKTGNKGIGMGLPLSLAIVTRLGGTIQVDNQNGSGAVFQVKLPIHLV